MIVWNVSAAYIDQENKIKYVVLPYNLFGTIAAHIKYHTPFSVFWDFIKNSRLTKKSAMKYAEKRNNAYDIKN